MLFSEITNKFNEAIESWPLEETDMRRHGDKLLKDKYRTHATPKRRPLWRSQRYYCNHIDPSVSSGKLTMEKTLRLLHLVSKPGKGWRLDSKERYYADLMKRDSPTKDNE